MKPKILVLATLVAIIACFIESEARAPTGPVKHYVVLMMENRAYDHMLGWLKLPGERLNGLTGSEWNPWNVSDSSRRIFVNQDAKDISPNPDHGVSGITEQVFGTRSPPPHAEATMNGFVQNSRRYWNDEMAPIIMECWNASKVPILSSLARHFTLFDDWYASVPGPTYPNRMYFHTGTSDGVCRNVVPPDGYEIGTLYQQLDEAGYDWAFYYDQVTDSSFFNYTRHPRFSSRWRNMDAFYANTRAGTLPTVSFLMPRFFSTETVLADDQHPDHAVSIGEALIKRVYEALRNSPSWESSAFLLTYDEHGGFYDHQPTPVHDVPNPDGKNCPVGSTGQFDFRRLGIRVPTVLISPWVDHSVVHEPKGFIPHPSSKFEHSSFIATLTRLLGLKGQLTKRTAWAAPFDYLFNRTTPRKDCPTHLPPVHQESLRQYLAIRAKSPEHLEPLDELHISYLQVANSMIGLPDDENLAKLHTQQDGADYATSLMDSWHQRALEFERN